MPLAGLLLRRLGSQFVERFDRHKGATDARRVLKLAATGQSLMFFPEGTFDETRQIGKFLGGAFTTAARAEMPVVAVAIHGTRAVMPPGGLSVHRLPIRVEVLAVLPADEARNQKPRTHCPGRRGPVGALKTASGGYNIEFVSLTDPTL